MARVLATKVTCKEEVRANVQKEEEVENVEFSSSTCIKKKLLETPNLPCHVTTFKKLVFTLFDLVPRRTRWRMTRVPVTKKKTCL